MLNTSINNYFGFNRQQRNGLLMLLFIIVFLLAVRIIYPYFLTPDKIILANIPLVNDTALNISLRNATTEKNAERFNFDPNTTTEQQFIQLGLNKWLAARIIKARKSGFVFYKNQDLLKIHGVSQELYSSLSPYIKIAGSGPKPVQPSHLKPVLLAQAARTVELNSADSLALTDLPGIGPAFARRIIKYRTSLGGFTTKEQLTEVYGFKQGQYDKLKGLVTVDASKIVRININKDDFKTVNRHPYLSYELTKKIFNTRYKEPISETRFHEIVGDEKLVAKVLPYLVFN